VDITPVIILDRLAEHTGAGIKAFVYTTPFLARLSIFGVAIRDVP
jgi:hypothetical protein